MIVDNRCTICYNLVKLIQKLSISEKQPSSPRANSRNGNRFSNCAVMGNINSNNNQMNEIEKILNKLAIEDGFFSEPIKKKTEVVYDKQKKNRTVFWEVSFDDDKTKRGQNVIYGDEKDVDNYFIELRKRFPKGGEIKLSQNNFSEWDS